MKREGIILDTDRPLAASERRARWYALAASLGLIVLGPRVPRPVADAHSLPSVGVGGGTVVRLRRRAK
jgi:hypothetical protein